jgi:hypothetical protein
MACEEPPTPLCVGWMLVVTQSTGAAGADEPARETVAVGPGRIAVPRG